MISSVASAGPSDTDAQALSAIVSLQDQSAALAKKITSSTDRINQLKNKLSAAERGEFVRSGVLIIGTVLLAKYLGSAAGKMIPLTPAQLANVDQLQKALEAAKSDAAVQDRTPIWGLFADLFDTAGVGGAERALTRAQQVNSIRMAMIFRNVGAAVSASAVGFNDLRSNRMAQKMKETISSIAQRHSLSEGQVQEKMVQELLVNRFYLDRMMEDMNQKVEIDLADAIHTGNSGVGIIDGLVGANRVRSDKAEIYAESLRLDLEKAQLAVAAQLIAELKALTQHQ